MDRQEDIQSWSTKDNCSPDDYRCDDRGPSQRPKLNLKPQSTPKEDDSSAGTSQFSQAASIFGAAKPADPPVRQQVEDQLQKEWEKSQHQFDEPQLEWQPQERHPNWQREEYLEQWWSRTGSASSQIRTLPHLPQVRPGYMKEREWDVSGKWNTQ